MITRRRKLAWGLGMFCLASGPATLLVGFPAAALIYAPVNILDGEWIDGLLGFVWGGFGVAGTLALWRVTLCGWSRCWVPFGLIAGLIAWLPLLGIFPFRRVLHADFWAPDWDLVYFLTTFVTLPVVAMALIVADFRYLLGATKPVEA